MLKAIETQYNGYRFRSRQEARSAVFFDMLGISYRYEFEGFNLNGTRYLPDFWLPDHGWWIEIKGKLPNHDEISKGSLLAQHAKKPVMITWANFDLRTCWDSIAFWTDENGIFHSQEHYTWHACQACGQLNLLPREMLTCNQHGTVTGRQAVGGWICPACSNWMVYDHPDVIEAYAAARQARFEREQIPKERQRIHIGY